MIHGPCGKKFPNARCMKDGKYGKNFPKAFANATLVNEDIGYPTYLQCSPQDGGRTVLLHNNTIDNR